MKGVGSSEIGGVQGAQERLGEGKEKAEDEMKGEVFVEFASAGAPVNFFGRFRNTRSLTLNTVRLSRHSSLSSFILYST